MVRHTLKILQQMLKDFYSVSDHFGTLWIKGLNTSRKNVIIDQVKSMRSLSYIGEKKIFIRNNR